MYVKLVWRCYWFPVHVLCCVWIQGLVIRECIIPVYLSTSQIFPFSSLRLWLPFLDIISVYSVWGRVCGCHCQLGSSSWWIGCLLAIWCVGGMMWLALSAGILQRYSPSPAEKNLLPVHRHVAGAAYCSCLRRQLSPYLMLQLPVPLKPAPKGCQSKRCCSLFLRIEAGIPAV